MLEKDEILRLFVIDFGDGRLWWRVPPRTHPRLAGCEAGTPTPTHSGKRYWIVKVKGRPLKRGQIIFTAATGEWPRPCLDHADGNSLNDAISNLRVATSMQNAWNHKKRSKESDTPMGIRRLPSGRYQARIARNHRKIAVGTFDTQEAAYAAYLAAREVYFGRFA